MDCCLEMDWNNVNFLTVEEGEGGGNYFVQPSEPGGVTVMASEDMMNMIPIDQGSNVVFRTLEGFNEGNNQVQVIGFLDEGQQMQYVESMNVNMTEAEILAQFHAQQQAIIQGEGGVVEGEEISHNVVEEVMGENVVIVQTEDQIPSDSTNMTSVEVPEIIEQHFVSTEEDKTEIEKKEPMELGTEGVLEEAITITQDVVTTDTKPEIAVAEEQETASEHNVPSPSSSHQIQQSEVVFKHPDSVNLPSRSRVSPVPVTESSDSKVASGVDAKSVPEHPKEPIALVELSDDSDDDDLLVDVPETDNGVIYISSDEEDEVYKTAMLNCMSMEKVKQPVNISANNYKPRFVSREKMHKRHPRSRGQSFRTIMNTAIAEDKFHPDFTEQIMHKRVVSRLRSLGHTVRSYTDGGSLIISNKMNVKMYYSAFSCRFEPVLADPVYENYVQEYRKTLDINMWKSRGRKRKEVSACSDGQSTTSIDHCLLLYYSINCL